MNESNTASREKDIFENAGEIKSADLKADKIRKNK